MVGFGGYANLEIYTVGMMPHSQNITQQIDRHQVRMARSGLGLSIRDLAMLCGLNKATIVRMEAGQPVRRSTFEAVRKVLEAEGAEFLHCSETGRVAVSIKPD